MKLQEDPPSMTRQKIVRTKEQSIRPLSPTNAEARKTSRDTDAPIGLAHRKTARLADDLQRLRAEFDRYAEESQQEMQRLSRRVYQLEQLAKTIRRERPTTGATRTPMPSARSLFTFLGRPAFPSLS